MRLVREGNLFTAYRSTNWNHLVSCRHRDDCDGVNGLRRPGYYEQQSPSDGDSDIHQRHGENFVAGDESAADRVDHSARRAGATFTAPATITVTAAASDTDGTITKVDFYRSGQFVRVGHHELV